MTHHKPPTAKSRRGNMNTSTAPRCRNHFWFLVIALFVLWYLLLYANDWPSFRRFNPLPHHHHHHHPHPLPNPTHPLDSNLINLNNHHHEIVNIKPNNSDNIGNVSRDDDDDDGDGDREEWTEDINQIRRLERELEPLLKIHEPKIDPCSGKYIYVHDIPKRFNHDLIQQCGSLSKWSDMCQYMINNGLGPDLGNPQRLFLPTGWYSTHQFSLEVIFHNRMKQYKCLTNDSTAAAAVFVPYYAGLDVARYLWGYNISVRDKDSLDLARWLRGRREWKGMFGRDHFMVAGRITWDFRRGTMDESAWGNKLMLLPEFKNVTILTIESSPWNNNDYAIPYPTYFHPSTDNEVVQWQNKMRRQRRRIMFSFAGAPRAHLEDSIRGEIIDQCLATNRKCKLIQCKNHGNKCHKPVNVMKMFQNSIFCLQPPGDSFTRRSTFDSILAGCIPVFFSPGSAYVQYLWHLPRDFSKYSVLIPEDDVKRKNESIEGWLSQIPKPKVLAMRDEVIRLIPRVIYADPRSRLETIEDAFDITVKGVLERVKTLRRDVREGRNFDVDEEYSWKYNLFGTVDKHEWDHFFLRTNRGRY